MLNQPQQIDPNNLTEEQRVNILKGLHSFLANYDRVPGFMAFDWAKQLDGLAIVINSLSNPPSKK